MGHVKREDDASSVERINRTRVRATIVDDEVQMMTREG